MRKKILIGAAAVTIAALALTGCSQRGNGSSTDDAIKKGDTVGVALPAKTSQNWVLAKQAFVDALDKAGFKADVQYASATNTVPDQQNEIQSMVTKGDKVIIVAAQDGSQLGTQVAQAKKNGATVIAWDRNLLNTKNVDYYVAFNNYKVGQLQAQALLDGMKKKKKASGPYNIELFAGASTDANATVFFNGAMSVLQPKIDSGDLVVSSGQTTFKQVNTDGWLAQNAQTRMTNIITSTYAGGKALDGVLSPNDTLGRAILTATKQAGLPNPIVTGQDSETASIPLIMNGTQYSTIYKNTDEEAQAAVKLVSELAAGKKPTGVDYSDKTNAGNGSKTVPYVALTPILVTKDNAVKAYSNNPTLEKLAKDNQQ
ncbi:substrate-binding domain-containing protein [Rathayibacter sp. CAU 1779]